MSGDAGSRPLPAGGRAERKTGGSRSVAVNEARIGRLLNRLGWATSTISLAAVFLVAACFYWLQARPQTDATAKARQNEAAERVVGRVQNLVGQVERILATMQLWSADGLASIDDPEAFNRLLIPVLQLRSVVSSLHLASDDGREILLIGSSEGFQNRITDIPRNGTRQLWLAWKDGRTRLGEEWKEQDYDPRRRPWFTGALDTAENRVHWTAPYTFQATKEPGITASVRWTDKASGRQFVVAMDVLLTDFSRSTRELAYGRQGQVAVLTADGKVLGLPRHARFSSDDEINAAVLQLPEDIGLPLLAAALEKADGNEGTFRLPAASAGAAESWLATLRRIPFGNQHFVVAMLAPEDDFSPWSRDLLAVLFFVLAAVAAFSVVLSRRLAGDVSEPLGKVFRELAVGNRELERQGRRSTAVAELLPRLQEADNFDALSRALLSGLAGRLPLGQGSVYLADAESRRLHLCGGHARTSAGAPPADIAYGEGLLGQCAVERKLIRLDRPGADYLRVESVLAAGEPATILVLPVLNKDVLLGVVELALLAGFDDDDMALVDGLMPMFALCMEVVARNERTREILRASQAQEERIRSMLGEQDAIFSKAPMGIMYAAGGRVLRVNAAMTQLFGHDAGELVGAETVTLFVSPESYREFAAQVGPKLAAGEGVHLEWPMRQGDGSVFLAMLSAQAVDIAGVERAAIWIIEDISERKRLEEATRASEARLRQVLEESPAAVTMVRESGEPLFANRRLAELLGVPPDELMQHNTVEFWADPEERQRFLRHLHEQGRVDAYEARFRRADGGEVTLSVNTRWIEQDGERLMLSWLSEPLGRKQGDVR